ncbi:MAG: rhomboid family intramembrane serine protease [Nocardioides sp.]
MSEPPAAGPASPQPVDQSCYRHPGRETYIRCQRCGQPICPDCMHDASVGFHCPSCVREGARSTRQARTTYGGVPSANPALTSLVLIGVNVAVWLAIMATGGNSSRLLDFLAIKLAGYCRGELAMPEAVCESAGLPWSPGVAEGAYWEVLTSVFTHVSLLHIAFNMFALYMLGPQLESLIGRVRFLALYLLSGLGGSAAVLWLAGNPFDTTVGASGSIFGLMGGLLITIYKRGGDPRPLLVWILINAAITFTTPSISWQGHLGGFVTGLVLAGVLAYAPREHRSRVQIAGMVVVGLVLALFILARAATF